MTHLDLESFPDFVSDVRAEVAHGAGEDAEKTVQHPVLSKELSVGSERYTGTAHCQSNWGRSELKLYLHDRTLQLLLYYHCIQN